MEQMQINAKPRQRVAKGDNRRLRREGQVPAVIYGGQQVPATVAVNNHEMELILRGARHSSAVFNLVLDGGAGLEQTIIRELQRHPVTSRLMHIDFQRVDLEQEIEVSVAVHAVGTTPVGVKAGGVLEHVNRELTIRCKPLTIPKHLEADLSNLDINHSFHVRDMALPAEITVLDDPETALFTILPPKAGEEAAAEAAGGAEPEMIGKKKAEEEA